MTPPRMSSGDRRALLVGVSTIGLLVTIVRGIPAATAWNRAAVDESVRAAQRLAASRVDAASLRAARDTLTARRARLAVLDSFIPLAESPAAAAAGLATVVERLADSCAVRVSTVQLHSDSVPLLGMIAVSARIGGATDVTGLAAFLRATASASAALVVRELDVTSPEPGGPASKPEALRFDATIAGLARLDGPRTP